MLSYYYAVMFKKYEFMSESEKIDEIYRMLRAQRRSAIISSVFSWTIRLAIIGAIWFWYQKIVVEWDTSFQEKIQSFIVKQMSSIVWPIVWDVVKNNPNLIPGASPSFENPSTVSAPTMSTTSTDAKAVTEHKNIPKARPVEDLLKDEELMKAATEMYKKGVGQ